MSDSKAGGFADAEQARRGGAALQWNSAQGRLPPRLRREPPSIGSPRHAHPTRRNADHGHNTGHNLRDGARRIRRRRRGTSRRARRALRAL